MMSLYQLLEVAVVGSTIHSTTLFMEKLLVNRIYIKSVTCSHAIVDKITYFSLYRSNPFKIKL